MIVLANSRDIPALKDFCAGDAVGCRIGCNIDSYKTNLPFAPVWKIEQDGSLSGVISKLDGAVTLLCKTESAYLEAKEFIKMLPDVCEILSNSGENGAVMKFCGTPKKPAAEVTFASAQETAKLILRAQNLPSEEFDRIYVDISHRIRHNFLYTAVFRKDGIPVSCACAHISGGDALISTVYTLWQHRKNGFAAEVLNFLCEKFADKNIFLMCERTLTEYYKKSGFSVTGGYNLESTLL